MALRAVERAMQSTGAIILVLSNDIHDSDILEARVVRYILLTGNPRKKSTLLFGN